MQIEGFTYVRNGFKMGYPFIASIQSVLPIVKRLIVVVGDSDDGTREAIENLENEKIIIVDSVWDEDKRKSGQIFREQSNIGIDNLSTNCDWAFHIQADEVLKETDQDNILSYIKIANNIKNIDGLLFPFYHFWGDFKYIRHTRRTHAFEIRAFKNNRNVHSYRDSQGFRIFPPSMPNSKGVKLKVLKTDIPIYHYSYTRNPGLMNKQHNFFERFYHNDDWLNNNTDEKDFDYNKVDRLDIFKGLHPVYMNEVIKNKDWEFEYDPSKSIIRFKDKLLYPIEKYFNYRLFEYKNYKVKPLPAKCNKQLLLSSN